MTRFCVCASARQGSMNPFCTLAKNQSSSKQTDGSWRSATCGATVLLPQPGEPVRSRTGAGGMRASLRALLPGFGEAPGATLGAMGQRLADFGVLSGPGNALIAQQPGSRVELSDGDPFVPRSRVPAVRRHRPGGAALGAAAHAGAPAMEPSENASRHQGNPFTPWPATRGCGASAATPMDVTDAPIRSRLGPCPPRAG